MNDYMLTLTVAVGISLVLFLKFSSLSGFLCPEFRRNRKQTQIKLKNIHY